MIDFNHILCEKWRVFKFDTEKGQGVQIDQAIKKLDNFLMSCSTGATAEDRDALYLLADIAADIAGAASANAMLHGLDPEKFPRK